jgi:hypothetical protein
MTVPPQAPQPSTVPELLNALAALGAPAEVPAHLDDADAVLHLSHGLGAAEREATEADLAARAGGSDSPEILPAIEEAYAAANAQSRLGRARARAVAGHPAGAGPASLLADMSRDDPVLSTAIVATAGVSGLLAAQASMATGDRVGAVDPFLRDPAATPAQDRARTHQPLAPHRIGQQPDQRGEHRSAPRRTFRSPGRSTAIPHGWPCRRARRGVLVGTR